MISWLINKRLDASERRLGVSMDYLRHMAAVSKSAFFKFVLMAPAASHGSKLPREMLHAARIVAAMSEDCGPCVQIAVNIALDEGVAAELLERVLASDPEKMPADVALAWRFARSIVERDGQTDQLRRELRERFGEAAVVELSLAVAIGRTFPTLKRGLGFSAACSLHPVSVKRQVDARRQASAPPERTLEPTGD